MKQTGKVLSVVFSTLLLFVVITSAAVAANPPQAASAIKDKKPVQTGIPNVDICKDPTVRNFSVSKSLAGNVATFTMSGQVCNNGPGDYHQADNILNAHFNVYTAYGPMFSYPASGEVKFFTLPVGPNLKKGQCMPFTQVVTRDKVIQWGFKPPTAAVPANEKQVRMLFEFFVRDAKGTLGTVSQQKSLDCNASNNLLSQTIEMTISTQ